MLCQEIGRRLAVVGVALAFGACDEPISTGTEARPVGDVRPYVTSEAAAALDGQGRFTRSALVDTPERGIIDAQRAIALANAYIRTFGRDFQQTWQDQRGAPLALASLRASSVAFASTPYEALPSGVHPGLRNAFGSYFLVTFTADAQPALLVAVAANNVDARIDDSGQLLLPKLHGNDFRGQGIPASAVSSRAREFFPLSAEEAVVAAGRATGAKIEQVPELVLLDVSNAPVTAVWRLVLNRVVPLPGAARAEGSELFVTTEGGSRYRAASVQQPATIDFPLLFVDANGAARGPIHTSIGVKHGRVVAFDRVTIPPGGVQ